MDYEKRKESTLNMMLRSTTQIVFYVLESTCYSAIEATKRRLTCKPLVTSFVRICLHITKRSIYSKRKTIKKLKADLSAPLQCAMYAE